MQVDQLERFIKLRDDETRLPKSLEMELITLCQNFQEYINFKNGRWEKLNMGTYSKLIEEWIVKQGMTFRAGKQPTIVKQLHTISFPNLLLLSLVDNQIQSLECVNFLNAPNLEILRLDHNKIMNMKSLRKGNFPNLKYIDTSTNFNWENSWFTELDSSLERLGVEQRGEPYIWIDIRPIVKIKNWHKIKELWFSSNQRIIHQKVKKMIFMSPQGNPQ